MTGVEVEGRNEIGTGHLVQDERGREARGVGHGAAPVSRLPPALLAELLYERGAGLTVDQFVALAGHQRAAGLPVGMLGAQRVDEHVGVVDKASHGSWGYIRRQRAS